MLFNRTVRRCLESYRNGVLKGAMIVAATVFSNALAINDAHADKGALASALLSEDSKYDIRGWVDSGFTFNTTSSSSYNGTVSFNDRAEEFQMNQAYFIFERTVEHGGDAWDLGGRVDATYGTDSQFTMSSGFDDEWIKDSTNRFYKAAVPQAYLEANVPVLNGVSIKGGHFYTPIGYEVVTAPDNFLYSHAYTMQYGEPFTHWGALASTPFADGNFTLTMGAVRGWDNMSDTADGNLSFLGGASLTACDTTTVTFTLISGNEGHGLNRTMYSLVLSHKLGDNLSYVLQHDNGTQDIEGSSNANWYGVNQYLIYKLSDSLSSGVRLEWFRDADGARVVGVRSGAGGVPADYYGVSVGLNYKALDYLSFRPEIRYDIQDRSESGTAKAFDRGQDNTQLTVAMDAILKF